MSVVAIFIVRPCTLSNDGENNRDVKSQKLAKSGARKSTHPKLTSRKVTSIEANSRNVGKQRPWATVSL